MANSTFQAPLYEEYLCELCLISVLFFPSTSVQNHMTPISSYLKQFIGSDLFSVLPKHIKLLQVPWFFMVFFTIQNSDEYLNITMRWKEVKITFQLRKTKQTKAWI